MVWLCSTNPHVTSLNMDWATALELPVARRNKLIEKLDEMQRAEAQATKHATGR